MFNPIDSSASALNSYINFWENASTSERVSVHVKTLMSVFILRLSMQATPATIGLIYESMIVLGLAMHVLLAVRAGESAKDGLNPTTVNQEQTDRLNRIEQQCKSIFEALQSLKKNT